jgi:hypothetical protein
MRTTESGIFRVMVASIPDTINDYKTTCVTFMAIRHADNAWTYEINLHANGTCVISHKTFDAAVNSLAKVLPPSKREQADEFRRKANELLNLAEKLEQE